jgi:hypothetical protein
VTSIRVLNLNGVPFVTGLFWKALTTPKNFMREARSIGKREGMDIVVLRETASKCQAGFIKSGAGIKKGMFSIATALAGELGDNWIGVFRIGEDQYLMAGVSQGAIIPQGDKIGDEHDALRYVRHMLGLGVPNAKIYAPEALDIAESEELDLEAILDKPKYPKAYQLKPLTFGLSQREMVYLAGAAVVVAAALALYLKLQADAREAERQAEIQRQRMLAELEAETGREADIHALEYPWPNQPHPHQVQRQCLGALTQAPLVVAGWRFVKAGCNGEEAVVTYRRSPYATINDFHDAASVVFDFVEVDEAGELGVVGHTLTIDRFGDEDLLGRLEALNDLRSFYQQKGASLRIGEWSASGYSPELIELGALDWSAFEFTVQGNTEGLINLGSFYQPGLRFEEILMDAAGSNGGMQWTLRGKQYVN